MITDKIEKTIEKYNMLSSGDTVAVGVSGGADSMLLLDYLVKNRERYGITVVAANVEHGIRGVSSKRDSEFVKAYCTKNGVEFKGLSINAPKEAAEAKMGVEEYSRKRRYEFFASLSADKIATAHSLSDSAETVLLRLARGSSIRGLCSIPPVRDNIIRPLIECTADEIRAYCRDNGIGFVVDETNSDNAYSRNFVRNEIIPRLKELNPAVETAIARLISSSKEVDEMLEAEAEKLTFPLEIKALKNAYTAVAKRAIQNYAESFKISLDEKHLNETYSLIFKRGKIQLKGDVFAVSDGECLTVKRLEDASGGADFCLSFKTVSASEFLNNYELLKKQFAFYCDCDKIVGNISVRSRAEGDRITIAKRGVTKSLKKLMNELKIPEDKRPLIPVICDNNGIIGVYGYAVSQRVSPDDETKNYYLLKISLEDNN